ncbi:MAG: hypothetical protein ACOY4U_11325 [Pseudomonadota bacterium]
MILEAIGDAVIEYFLVAIFYWPGWAVLRTLTLGHYPRGRRGTDHNEGFVSLVGLLAFVVPYLSYLMA